MTSAILRDTVPATIIRSACRGEARKTPAPNRSMSYREETVAIISMAQHASPNVIGHSADFLAQFTRASRFDVMTFASNCRSSPLMSVAPGDGRAAMGDRNENKSALAPRASRPARRYSVPFQRSLLPGIPKADQENGDEHHHLDQSDEPQPPEIHGPGKEEDEFDVEDDEEHGDDVVAHRKLDTGIGEQRAAAFVRLELRAIRPPRPEDAARQEGDRSEAERDHDEDQDRDVVQRRQFSAH